MAPVGVHHPYQFARRGFLNVEWKEAAIEGALVVVSASTSDAKYTSLTGGSKRPYFTATDKRRDIPLCQSQDAFNLSLKNKGRRDRAAR